jgi:hypothetical protein
MQRDPTSVRRPPTAGLDCIAAARRSARNVVNGDGSIPWSTDIGPPSVNTAPTAPRAVRWVQAGEQLSSHDNDFAALAQGIKMIRPSLHHLPPRRQMLRMVVSRLHSVVFGMRELPLDHVRRPSLFMQQRRRHAPKPVRRDHRPVVSHPPQRRVDRVLPPVPI